jgi:hypothetical protein
VNLKGGQKGSPPFKFTAEHTFTIFT